MSLDLESMGQKDREASRVRTEVDCERLPRWIRFGARTRESEDRRSTLRYRISIAAQYGIRRNTVDLWNRSRDVLNRQFGTLSERGHKEDRNPTQRESTTPRKSTGPPEARKPSSCSRSAYRALETQRAWKKQNENGQRGFNLRVPIRSSMQLGTPNARFGSQANGDNAMRPSTNRKATPPYNGSARYHEILRLRLRINSGA
jgi:hypothetical protein